MDFMNLNQSAHGDREFGFICTRLNINREVVVGYYKNESVIEKIKALTSFIALNRDKISTFKTISAKKAMKIINKFPKIEAIK
jgi:L-arabinose isomerase